MSASNTLDGGFIKFSVVGSMPYNTLPTGSYFALSIQGRLYPYVKMRSRKAQSLYGLSGSESDITPLPGATVHRLVLGDQWDGKNYTELVPVSPITDTEVDGFVMAESLG